jgi:glycosyltransferase involved in cell wall biosynthesis
MDRPIKVVHLVLALDVGGLEEVVLRLVAHTDRDRFTPLVYALDAPGVMASELTALDVPLRIVPRALGLDPALPVRLARCLVRDGVRILHTHNASPHFYGAVAASLARAGSRGPGPRVIHTKHGRNRPEVRRKVLLNRVASALTDRVVAVSDDAADVALHVEHVAPNKVMTIRNGVDTKAFRPGDPRIARARLGLPEDGFHVGVVARLAAVKDHATLLEAFAILRKERGDAHLTIVGDGPERAALLARSRADDLAGSIHFVGERRDVAAVLPAFDVFALSSTSEGISLTLLEAAAAGLPIVATRVGGNAEVVIDGETGTLVSPRDPAAFAGALGAMARRPDRAVLGLGGRARVERWFSVERMAGAYQDLYAEVLHEPR